MPHQRTSNNTLLWGLALQAAQSTKNRRHLQFGDRPTGRGREV